MLLKKCISTEDDKILKKITEVKRYHPLALHQAITYINNTHVSPQEYLDLFKDNPVDILDEFIHTEQDAKSAVLSIRIILQKLKINHEKLSLQILKFLSYCDGKNITMTFVKQISFHLKQNDRVKIYHAINVLKNFSLLSDCCDSNLNKGYLLMHDITQIACFHFQKNKQKYYNIVVSFIKQKLNMVKDHYEYGIDWYKHFLHIFLKNKAKVACDFNEHAEEIFCLLQNKGLFKDILAILEEIECFQTVTYGRNNTLVIDTKHLKAQCFYNMGEFEKAFPVYAELEKLRSKLIGKNHLSTLKVKHNKALCMDGMGDYVGAFKIYCAIEKQYMSLNTVGKKHPKTLETKHNKANCMINLGKFDEALQEYHELVKLKIEVLGENDPSTLDTKHNLALCMDCLGRHHDAYQMYSKLEEVKIKVLGNSHPSTLKTKHNKTNYFINTGQYDKAFQEYIEIEKLLVLVLGENHPLTLETKHNLAFCLEKMGKYEEALHIYTEVEKLRSEILGNNHPKTLITQHSIQKVTSCKNNMRKSSVSDNIKFNKQKLTECHSQCIEEEHSMTYKSKSMRKLFGCYCLRRYTKTFSKSKNCSLEVFSSI
ncbi:uncharacterized protein LOC101234299 [Hydra vulgaris]|uniref:uncharacterized protein LOC101234299 n=1 Tax=Hydra vulgaris TaxID=6087 RepID=UPI001F5EE7AA|nr:uncharacterized protein LOC101234299 [Hydra vulgaris]XP_047142716.1 uncharacterized protein LOC101234299 [Hydra vulgaris]XP_047143191.1 uncharacterized protein LOC101234299 [Hydra vulgaris]XP_047143724.1 uncharacterized protein LOC101234299 [Hydra vulgaris]